MKESSGLRCHISLPKPGNERQLKRLAARIMSQQLDRGKPLWETWIVEGLDGGRFAMISKVHYCMIDGIAGADLLSVILSPPPDATVPDPVRWMNLRRAADRGAIEGHA